MFLRNVHNRADLVHPFRLAECPLVRVICRHPFTQPNELARRQQFVNFLRRRLRSPFDLTLPRLPLRLHGGTHRHELVGVSLDNFQIERICHAKRRKQYAHVNVIAIHVV